MIRTIAFLCLVATASAFFGFGENKPWNPDLLHKFGMNPLDSSNFAPLPRTSEAAEKKGWEIVEAPPLSSGYASLTLWVHKTNYNVGVYCDKNGQVVGMLIAVPADKVETYFDPIEQGLVPWTPIIDGIPTKYWSTCLFFAKESSLDTLQFNLTEVLRDDSLVVPDLDGTMVEVPTTTDKLDGTWKKQACVPWMGEHFYKNMTVSLTCDHPFFLFFPLYQNGQMIGVGFMLLLKNTTMSKTENNRIEHPTSDNVRIIVPNGPKCLIDLVKAYFVITLHVYFINTPRLLLTC